MPTREIFQKTTKGTTKKKAAYDHLDVALHFVSTTSSNFGFPKEMSKVAVMLLPLSTKKGYSFNTQYEFNAESEILLT